MLRRFLTTASVIALLAAPAAAQTFNSGSTEADGDFSPSISTTVTLPASGVFNYRTVTIPAGVVVRYLRNAANTPVTILASGNVIIAGTIDVTGAAGGNIALNTTNVAPNGGVGGPGGFDGGAGSNGIVTTTGGSGLGPGGGAGGPGGSAGGGGFVNAGGNAQGGGSGAGGTTYGTAPLLPLIGGSGGGGGGAGLPHSAGGGGGGGGALVIASSGTITLTGSLLATGGAGGGNPINLAGAGAGGGGTGGAVRLVATTIAGSGGSINANGQLGGGAFDFGLGNRSVGGAGSVGRIRLEAYTNTLAANFNGVSPSLAQPSSVTLSNGPTLRITAVGGVSAPAAPGASFGNPDVILPATTTNPVTINLAGTNIPSGTVVSVTVKGQRDAVSTGSATLTGTPASTTGSASVTIPTNQPALISVTASFTFVASTGGPVFVEGEIVERVRVSATVGGASQVAYITKSGREIVVAAER